MEHNPGEEVPRHPLLNCGGGDADVPRPVTEAVAETKGPPPLPSEERMTAAEMKGCTWALSAIVAALGFLVFAVGFLVKSCDRNRDAGRTAGSWSMPGNGDESQGGSGRDPSAGLELEQLERTTIPLLGEWEEEDVLVNDGEQWTGSTCVYSESDELLGLVTNLHCLGLEGLAGSDDDGKPEIMSYSLTLLFPSGPRQAIGLGVFDTDLDLAVVIVEKAGLVPGRDYVMIHPDKGELRKGMEVVAVGSPLCPELEGTHTFGRISAFRGDGMQLIQTDAAINPGNSGGPLFVKKGGRYSWIGVNTFKIITGEGMGFAINRAFFDSDPDPHVFTADPDGVGMLLRNGAR